MMPMPVNRITSQCKTKIIAKIIPVNKFTTLKFLLLLLSMNGQFFLDYYVLLCNTCLYRLVCRHGHYCHSSPLAEVRIPCRAAACGHFLVKNKGAGQFYLNFDTRQLTIPIPFSSIGSNVQQKKPLRMHCNTTKCMQQEFEPKLPTDILKMLKNNSFDVRAGFGAIYSASKTKKYLLKNSMIGYQLLFSFLANIEFSSPENSNLRLLLPGNHLFLKFPNNFTAEF